MEGVDSSNISEIISLLFPSLVDNVGWIITLLKAIGIAFIVYIIYSIVMAILNIRRMRVLNRIENKIDSLEKKIDKVVAKEKTSKKKR